MIFEKEINSITQTSYCDNRLRLSSSKSYSHVVSADGCEAAVFCTHCGRIRTNIIHVKGTVLAEANPMMQGFRLNSDDKFNVAFLYIILFVLRHLVSVL